MHFGEAQGAELLEAEPGLDPPSSRNSVSWRVDVEGLDVEGDGVVWASGFAGGGGATLPQIAQYPARQTRWSRVPPPS